MYLSHAELPLSRPLFRHPATSALWLPLRLWLGYGWATSGYAKLFGPDHAGWLSGAGLRGFIGGAMRKTGGAHPDVAYSWYAHVLRWASGQAEWLANTVAITEFAVGIALLTGTLTGLAAIVGAMLNISYGLAGSAGVNPVFLLASFTLMLAWRNAGLLGLDGLLLPWLTRRLNHSTPPGVTEGAERERSAPTTRVRPA